MTSPPRHPPRPVDPRPPDPAILVARAMTGLDGLDERPLAEHVAAFERMHTALIDALTAGSPPATG